MENTEVMEKYVAKALEGYEQNYAGISEAIEKMEAQLAEYRGHQAEMLEGIREMREILGLGEEGEEPVLQLVTDEE
jgi:hypothetical protein